MGVCGEVSVTVSVAVWQTFDFVIAIEAGEWPASDAERLDLITELATSEYIVLRARDELPEPGHTEISDGPFLEGHDIITDPVQLVTDDLLALAAELKADP